MNNVILIGRMAKDPEMKTTTNGIPVANFTLAVTKQFKRDEADFIRCVAYKKTAELIGQYTKRGSQIGIEGSINTYSYDGKNGKVYVTEVICNNIEFLSTKEQGQAEPSRTKSVQEQADDFFGSVNTSSIDESDLPF